MQTTSTMQTTSQSKSGSVFGGSLLIAGCCIGAGLLGLPAITAQAGFQPSFFMFLLSWFFMTCTGLLLLEVNLWFKQEVSFVSMAEKILGKTGKIISWIVFLFLFYSLMVAFIVGTGSLLTVFFKTVLGKEIPEWISSLGFTCIFGAIVFCGTRVVDVCNRFLMGGLLLSYVSLVVLGIPYVKPDLLLHSDWKAASFILPVMIISFGFHNLVPSMTNYLQGDVKKLRLTIVIGSTIALVFNLIWEGLILGIVPLEGEAGLQQALKDGSMITASLRAILETSWVATFVECFAFFAIITTFLGVSLSFVDFLADGFHVAKTRLKKFLLCLLVFVPPLLFAFGNPQIFFSALNYAGAFGTVILFGILPALMVWKGRYQMHLQEKVAPIVPGGKLTLVLVMIFAVAVMVLQLIRELGVGS